MNLSTVEEGKARPLFLDIQKGDNLILYTALTHLVDLMGREDGIELWKGYVEYVADKTPLREIESFKAMRKGISRMDESGERNC